MVKNGSGVTKTPKVESTSADEQNPLGRIREILQKDSGRHLEERFARVDARIRQECATLRSESEQRIESLQKMVREEVDGLVTKLDQERSSRDQAFADLTRELKEVAERVRTNEQETRRLVLEQSKSLGDQIRTVHESESTARDEALLELRAGKTDRDLLAHLFAEFALRLSKNDLDDGPPDQDDS